MMKSLQKCLFVCLLLISSNINAQFFECYILKPPEKYLEGVKKIAIMDFNITTDGYNISGDKGQVLNDYMTSYLLDEYRGIYNIDKKEGKTYIKGATTNVFTIIERNRLSQVLNEQKMNQSGIVNDNQAVEVGKILGIDVMIIGTISFEAKDEESTNRYKDGSVSYCTKRIVSTEARMKIISVKTGQIIGTKEVAQTYSSKKCNKERSGLTSVSKLIDFCLKDIAYMLVDYYSPRYKLQKYKFVKIKNKEFKEQTNKAVKFIKSGDIDNAYTIYNEIYKADPYSAIAAHNLACLYDIVGNYAKAVEYWGIAAELDAKSYQKSLKHAEEELAVKGI